MIRRSSPGNRGDQRGQQRADARRRLGLDVACSSGRIAALRVDICRVRRAHGSCRRHDGRGRRRWRSAVRGFWRGRGARRRERRFARCERRFARRERRFQRRERRHRRGERCSPRGRSLRERALFVRARAAAGPGRVGQHVHSRQSARLVVQRSTDGVFPLHRAASDRDSALAVRPSGVGRSVRLPRIARCRLLRRTWRHDRQRSGQHGPREQGLHSASRRARESSAPTAPAARTR